MPDLPDGAGAAHDAAVVVQEQQPDPAPADDKE